MVALQVVVQKKICKNGNKQFFVDLLVLYESFKLLNDSKKKYK